MDPSSETEWLFDLTSPTTASTEAGSFPNWQDPNPPSLIPYNTTFPVNIGQQGISPTIFEPPSYSSSYHDAAWPTPSNLQYGTDDANSLVGLAASPFDIIEGNAQTSNPAFPPPYPPYGPNNNAQPRPMKTVTRRTTDRPAAKTVTRAYGGRAAVDNQLKALNQHKVFSPKFPNSAPPKDRFTHLKDLKQALKRLYPQCRTFDEIRFMLARDTAEISRRTPPSYLDSVQCESERGFGSEKDMIDGRLMEKSEVCVGMVTPGHLNLDEDNEKDLANVGTPEIPWRPIEQTVSDTEFEEPCAVAKAEGGNMDRFACPYFKHNPALHQSRQSCKGPGFQDVHRIK
jgi:hypothetical protein